MKERLRDRLTLGQKLRLKRAVFAPLTWALRLAARAHNFAEWLAASAAANGVELRRAFDVRLRPGPPRVEPFGTSDFLLLARAASDGRAESLDPERPVNTSVIILVWDYIVTSLVF